MKSLFAKFAVGGMLLLSCSLSASAMPMTFDFNYEFAGGNSLSGVIEGELQSDNDTVSIFSFELHYDGFFAANPVLRPPLRPLFASLSGTMVDMEGSGAGIGIGGYYFRIRENFGIAGISAVVLAGVVPPFLPGTLVEGELLAVERWSLTPRVAVPLPGTLALFALGFAGLSRTVRRTLTPFLSCAAQR